MRLICLIACVLVFAGPVSAQSAAELQAQLDAQLEINALLKQRIKSLEAELAVRDGGFDNTAVPLPSAAHGPEISRIDPEEDRALERALVRRGSAVLGAGVIEVTPSFAWVHSGRDAVNTTDDFHSTGLDARIGLEGGWMLGAGTSWDHRRISGSGSNSGMGDTSLSVWKQIASEQGPRPSVVASLRYSNPTGDDIGETLVPLGTGFHQVTARVSAVRTVAPIAFFGDVGYRYSFPERFSGVKFERAGAFGVGMGASLAVTPEISTSAALRFEFEDDIKRNGLSVPGSSRTMGIVDLGLGIVLRKNIFMNVNAGLGITDDAPDASLSIAFPIRF